MKKLQLLSFLAAFIAVIFSSAPTASAQQMCGAGFQFVVGQSGPNGTPVTFYDSSYVWNGTITNWDWTFNTGQTSTQQNPTITFSGVTSVYACLTITSMSGGITCTSTYCDTIYLNFFPPPCNATFGFQASPTGLVYFNGFTGGNVQWTWSFGDGTSGTGANPNHTYAQPGVYYVCLTVLDANGSTCTSCQFVTISSSTGCQAYFTFVQNGTTTFDFTDQSQGNITNYYWQFGDGFTSSFQNPTHVYFGTGPYVVCLTVSDSIQGCIDTYCDTVYNNSTGQCQASFTSSANPLNNNIISFQNNSTPSSGVSYFWNFGDGSSSTAANPVHSYAVSGIYNVCLTISVPGTTCSDTYCTSVTVGSVLGCQASFVWIPDSLGNGVQFFSTSSGSPTNYTWSFSNGVTSSLQDPFLQISTAGWYNACLTIWNNSGCQSTVCDSFYFGGNPSGCSSNFAIYPDTLTPHTYYAFNLASGTGAISYVWSWGDGTSSTGAYPSHTYAQGGLYTICLTITDATGCTSTTCYQWQLLRLSSSAPVTINVIPGATGLPVNPFDASVNFYPNPASDILFTEFELSKSSTVGFTMMNVTGQTVLTIAASEFNTGQHQVKMDVSDLSKGIYMLVIDNNGQRINKKVIIQ